MDHFDELDPELKKKLEPLKEVPPRNPQDAVRGKAVFLNQAAKLAQQPVTTGRKWRRNRWLGRNVRPIFTKKEKLPVMGTFTAIALALALLLGGTGGTVYASQSSIPGEALYPVKTLSEDVRNMITIDPQASIDLNLDLADRRVAEITALDTQDQPLDESVVVRLQEHLNTALQQMIHLDEDTFDDTLPQVKTRLETQEMNMQQVNKNEDPQGDALCTMTQNMIRDRIRLLEEGQESPVMLQQKLQTRQQIDQNDAGNGPAESPGAGNQNGNTQSQDTSSEDEDGSQSGQGYGQGAQSQDKDEQGTQDDQGNQYGQGAQNEPGTCLDSACTATPMPLNSGQGNGSGNGKGK